jgi:hypothetical protein
MPRFGRKRRGVDPFRLASFVRSHENCYPCAFRMRDVTSFVRIGIWVLIAAFLVLPLYELADYSEVWQNDGTVILPGLFFLFSGLALLARRGIPHGVRFIFAFLQIQVPVANTSQTGFFLDRIDTTPPIPSLAFTISNLRI